METVSVRWPFVRCPLARASNAAFSSGIRGVEEGDDDPRFIAIHWVVGRTKLTWLDWD